MLAGRQLLDFIASTVGTVIIPVCLTVNNNVMLTNTNIGDG